VVIFFKSDKWKGVLYLQVFRYVQDTDTETVGQSRRPWVVMLGPYSTVDEGKFFGCWAEGPVQTPSKIDV
ncbi:hypothetical protein L195_g045991, partial [Trifolium pratense]